MEKTGGILLPNGSLALSKDEIEYLRSMIGKAHRTEEEWTEIEDLLLERAVFTAIPIDEKMAKKYCVEGLLKDKGELIVFMSMGACTDYLTRIGAKRFGEYLNIAVLSVQDVLEIATAHKERVFFDPHDPVKGKVLGIDGRAQKWRVYLW